MAITKTITIDGQAVPFKASAAIPRYYRLRFRRDIFRDMKALMEAIQGADPEASALDIPSLEIFENVAYTMAKYADPDIPDDIEAWLDRFNTFSIYEVMPQLFELWALNVENQAESKKKFAALTAK